MSKNKMTNKAKEPIECFACHKMIQIGQTVIRHHISYFPEQIVNVHGGCHIKIHGFKSKFPHLKPNPAQTKRWYKKKGVFYSDLDVYVWEFDWLRWIDCVENGFMTKERQEKIQEEQLKHFWNEAYRIQEIRFRMNVKEIWSSY